MATENELMDRKENLKLVERRRLSLSDSEISYLLRDLERRIDDLREEFYKIEPEHFPRGTPDL